MSEYIEKWVKRASIHSTILSLVCKDHRLKIGITFKYNKLNRYMLLLYGNYLCVELCMLVDMKH